MSKNCCKITFIPDNMREGAVSSIYREILDKWDPSLVRKTIEGIITICDDERSFTFVEYTSELDGEGSALLLDNDTINAIGLYRFGIASLIINGEEKITWNNDGSEGRGINE